MRAYFCLTLTFFSCRTLVKKNILSQAKISKNGQPVQTVGHVQPVEPVQPVKPEDASESDVEPFTEPTQQPAEESEEQQIEPPLQQPLANLAENPNNN